MINRDGKGSEETDRSGEWVKCLSRRLSPLTYGVYGNIVDADDGTRSRDAYGSNYYCW